MRRRQRDGLRCVAHRARHEDRVAAAGGELHAALREQFEAVTATVARRLQYTGYAIGPARRVRARIQQLGDDPYGIVADDGLIQRRPVPACHAVGVRAMREEIGDAVGIVPVALAEQERREAVGRERSVFHEYRERAVVIALGGVIDDLLVVGVGPVRQQ